MTSADPNPRSSPETDAADNAPEAPETAAAQVTPERPDGPAPLGRPGDRLRIRRSVNYPAFLITGAILGFIVGGLIELFGPSAQLTDAGEAIYTPASTFSYIGVLFAMAGALLGAVVALVLDRRR